MSQQYNDIIREGFPDGGAPSLKSRLVRFRKWATKDAKISVHSAVCVVNGEATDGTRNAPVLVFEAPRPDPSLGGGGGGGMSSERNKNGGGTSSMGGIGGGGGGGGLGGGGGMMGGGGSGAPGGSGTGAPDSEARCGDVDGQADRVMYDRTIGCQVRTVRDVKADEAALSVPVASMVTPDLIASSDAGRAIFACVRSARSSSSDDPNNGDGVGGGGFWGAFGPTGKLEQAQAERIHQNSGTQLLVKILQERKRVETALVRHERISIENGGGGSTRMRSPRRRDLSRTGRRIWRSSSTSASRTSRTPGLWQQRIWRGAAPPSPRQPFRTGSPPPSRPTSALCRRRYAPPYAGSGTSLRYSRGASPACRLCRTSRQGPCSWRMSSRRSSRRVCCAIFRWCFPPA